MSQDRRRRGVMGAAARLALGPLALLVSAAGPQRGYSLEVPANAGMTLPGARAPARIVPRSAYAPAPLPNRNVDGPVAPRASNEPSVGASLFTRSDTYRGESLGGGSSAASEQERKVLPGAGFSLKMPLAPR